MSRFIVFFLGWVLFISMVAILAQLQHHKGTGHDTGAGEALEDLSRTTIVDGSVLESIRQAYKDRDYLTALTLLDRHASSFSTLAGEQAYHFFMLKGYVHSELWQHVEAEQSWRKAGGFATQSSRKQRVERLLDASTRILHDLNDERNLNHVYHASPGVGPASKLDGKIAVIYIFLTDGAMQSWSLKRREFVMQNWRRARDWLIGHAQRYQANPELVSRLFILDKNPYIKRLRVGDFDSNYEHAETVVQLVAENFGARTINDFINKIRREEQAEQAILVFHLARDGRSFASRCMYHCGSDSEFVFLMEEPDVKTWQSLEYAQAHETLHLFGADDLYAISGAKEFAVRDIMNYPSSLLQASTMEDVTAYAIGLQKKKPNTPFQIQTHSPRRP